MMGLSLLYITVKEKTEAQSISKVLLEERLIACANITDNMSSMYWWEGAIQSEKECVLIVKTKKELVEAVTDKVKEMHSYDCPCVLELKVEGGNVDYISWLNDAVE